MWTAFAEAGFLLCGLATFSLLVRTFGPANYGRYVSIAVLSGATATLATVWIGLLFLQQVLQNRDGIGKAFNSALTLSFISSAAALAISTPLAGVLVTTVPFGTALLFIGSELVAGSAVAVAGVTLQTAVGFRSATGLRLVLPVTRLLGVVLTLATGADSLNRLALIQCALFGAFSVAVIGYTARRLRIRIRLAPVSMAVLREGYPHALVNASLAVQEDADKILLVRFNFAAVGGLYSAAYKLVSLGLTPVRALVSSSHPRFLAENPDQRREHSRRAISYTAPAMAYGIVCVAVMNLLAPYAPDLLGHEYEGTVSMIRWLSVLVLLRSGCLFALNALLGLRRYWLRVSAILFSTVLNVVLNLLWIPKWSWQGAAAATLVTEVAFLLFTWTALIRAQQRHDRERSAPPRHRAPRVLQKAS
jgi:O-antigen/teichoic acid export membrane protein